MEQYLVNHVIALLALNLYPLIWNIYPMDFVLTLQNHQIRGMAWLADHH